MKIIGLSGSLKKASFNTALLREATGLAPAGMAIEHYPIGGLALFNEDEIVDGVFPPEAERIRQAVRMADGILFVTPEYNRSLPGVLKNAIDWISHAPNQPFSGKVVAIMGTSSGQLGTAFANHHLRQILVYLNAQTVLGPEVLVPHARTKFDAAGRLTDDGTRQFIARHLVQFEKLIRLTANQHT